MMKAAGGARTYGAPAVCWSLRAADNVLSSAATEKGDPLNLPIGVANGEFIPRSAVQVVWLDWPAAGRSTTVQFRRDSADGLSATGSAEGRRLSLMLSRNGGSWIGTAVMGDERELGTRNAVSGATHGVVMTRVEPSMCKL
jgi:hypothetical protein